MRSQSASGAKLKNIPVSEICRAATWSSVQTFSGHYALDDDSRSDAAVGIAVLYSVMDSTLKLPAPDRDTVRESPEVAHPR